MKTLYHDKTNSLDVELIYNTHANDLRTAIQERDIGKILSIFDNKGMLAKAGLTLTGKSKIQFENWLIRTLTSESPREGANKQVISSQADSLIKISRIWADFFPANTSNQPI
ncbi:hypothetical protein HV096_20740 [Citrobacter freundii]|nr:hypothetical protein [Citrobacter freundii]MBA8034467.1 hypothetical protein [Citrobacter freundii]